MMLLKLVTTFQPLAVFYKSLGMRVRLRRFSKVLSIYERCFGLDAKNLEIFLDHTFVRQALTNHVNITDSINNLVGRGFRLVTSSCVIAECEALGSLFFGTQRILEAHTILKCRHDYNPSRGAAWCIRKRIRVARKNGKIFRRLKKDEICFLFALASNDVELRELARTVPGMPILFIAQRCVNTEPIPETTLKLIDEMTSKSLKINEFEVSLSLVFRFCLLFFVPLFPAVFFIFSASLNMF